MNKFLSVLLLLSCSFYGKAQSIKSTDTHIHYMGRVAAHDTVTDLNWSGTSVKINFNGTGVKALLKDERGDNYYNVIVDGQVSQKIQLSPFKKDYVLAAGLPAGKHSVELFKRSEWVMGKTWFYGFDLDTGTTLLPAPAPKKRKIEFYGNSITCGYAIEDSSGKDRGTAPYENNYLSYAALTARHFNAEYSCIAKSGIGILVSWAPIIMPEMYDRLNPRDSLSKWDFKKYTPDVVVINLFQNDSWLVKQPNNPQFKARFGATPPTPQTIIEAYQNFVAALRGKYPKAQIICALGNMDATRQGSEWPGYIQKAVSNLKDKKIYAVAFPYKNTNGHPNITEQQAMADQLIAFIDKNIKW